jgi:hypothetical protein
MTVSQVFYESYAGFFYIWLASRISKESSSPRRDTASSPSKGKTTLEEAGSATGENSLAMDAAGLDEVGCPSWVPPDMAGETEEAAQDSAALKMPVDATWELLGRFYDVESDAD